MGAGNVAISRDLSDSPLPSAYVGRFAPSPSGSLHFGSLVAAVGSFLQARASKGKWLLRIEDLDTPRNVPGAADDIVRTLDAFGFEWSGPVAYQSRRLSVYRHYFSQLESRGRVYPCACSRSQIAAQDEQRYPGTCRNAAVDTANPVAYRFKIDSPLVKFEDRLQGPVNQDVGRECGDFVIKRRDGIFAYHLAVAVDDAEQGVTEVVRGADLLSSTPRQLLLQRALGFPSPQYVHLPLAVDGLGKKLSKASQSLAIDPNHAAESLWSCLAFLRQSPPEALRTVSTREMWQWAISNWRLSPLRQVKSGSSPLPQ